MHFTVRLEMSAMILQGEKYMGLQIQLPGCTCRLGGIVGCCGGDPGGNACGRFCILDGEWFEMGCILPCYFDA